MGIFSRMSDIVNSNLNALLDSAEDPEKMIRLIIQEMEDTLVEVRSSSARVLADRKTAQRRYAQIETDAESWEAKAKLAIAKGREDLARAALAEKKAIEDELASVGQELEATDEHIAQLNDEVGQLQSKLDDAKAKQQAIVLRSQTVESRIKVKRQVHRENIDDALVKFEQYERRMDRVEGELAAMDMGRESGLADEIDALAGDEALEAELERLKASMGEGASQRA